MRKLRSLFFAMMTIASVSFLTSCGDDDEPNPKATITFDPSATNDEVSLAVGAPIKFKVVVTSADKLKEFKANINIGGINLGDTVVTSFPGSGYEFQVDDVVSPAIAPGQKIVLTFTATTNKDEVTTRTYTINVLSDIATYTATILGNQNASTGSFFSSTDGTVLNSTNAKANSGKVDLVYYYSVGGTAQADLATLAAPSDANAQAVYGAGTTANIPSWATKNATKFKKLGSTASTYDNATDGSDIAAAYMNSSATEGSKADKLVAGNVFGFMTAAGKHGIAKVISVTLPTAPNNQSEIKLDIKVQR